MNSVNYDFWFIFALELNPLILILQLDRSMVKVNLKTENDLKGKTDRQNRMKCLPVHMHTRVVMILFKNASKLFKYAIAFTGRVLTATLIIFAHTKITM